MTEPGKARPNSCPCRRGWRLTSRGDVSPAAECLSVMGRGLDECLSVMGRGCALPLARGLCVDCLLLEGFVCIASGSRALCALPLARGLCVDCLWLEGFVCIASGSRASCALPLARGLTCVASGSRALCGLPLDRGLRVGEAGA
jgi:hypothetical protein